MAAAMGNTMPNIQRQLANSRIRPDAVGPSAGAADIARVTVPMTRPRSSGATTVIIVVISSGIMTAVPTAWTIRPRRSTQNAGANAAMRVPRQNTDMARPKACRVVTLCRNQPVTGMTTAMVSMNAVESHWAAVTSTENSRIRLGRALNMTVSFRITTNAAATSQRSTP